MESRSAGEKSRGVVRNAGFAGRVWAAPGLGVLHYVREASADVIAGAIRALERFSREASAVPSELEPRSGLGGLSVRVREFADNVVLIPPFPPRFSDVCTDGARGPSDLIRQRIGLLPRPPFEGSKIFVAALWACQCPPKLLEFANRHQTGRRLG